MRRARVTTAERLPADLDLRCGYAAAPWLVEAFRAIHGCTPGVWRKRQG